MDYDEKNTDELEAELYSRIHHDQADETIDKVTEPSATIQHSRTVTKHSVVNNNKSSNNCKMHRKATTKSHQRKKATEKCNPNPFAIASAMNIQIPKRLTPYTSYLSGVDSQPIDQSSTAEASEKNAREMISVEIDEPKQNKRQPNPFNRGFQRTEEKMKRYQQMQEKKAHANKVREDNRRKAHAKNAKENVTAENALAPKAISVADSDTEDEVYIYPPEEPTIIHITDDEGEANANVEKESEPMTIENVHDTCDHVNVDYDKRLSRHDDPFGGIDVADLNAIISDRAPSSNLPPISESASDHFAKPQRANRQSLKRSYDVSETDFAAVDVYESESSDLPENNVTKSRKLARTVRSESEGSDIDTTKRSKRMRKRRKSGSNRGSDYISSDESDDDDDVAAYLFDPEKVTRPYYLHRGEGVFNAVTKCSKRSTGLRTDQNRDIRMEVMDSSDDSQKNVAEELDNDEENWIVTDAVGDTDGIELNGLENLLDATGENVDENENVDTGNDANENVDGIESTVDKDDDNGVRSERLVIHPEMGWNSEMKAFYNDSWGGETHNASAIRKQMPRDSSAWRLDPKDLRSSYNPLKQVKCHNCRENGHRMAFCPQPKKEVICFMCGNAGHREMRCPHAICLKCGEKTNSYRRGCDRCFRMPQIICNKCRRRGHYARDCPDNWRAYHNTTDPVSTPKRLPTVPAKKFCSACARYGHRAEKCYDFQLLLQDDVIPSDIRSYEKVYPTDDPPIDNSMTTPYSMLENPRENFKFKWDVNESADRLYGRFMSATKIRRTDDVAGEAGTKRRRKAKKPEMMNKKLVLNPMNAQNIREKPKKQFAKNFYEETSTQSQKIDSQKEVTENANDSDVATQARRTENVPVEGDNDVVMKEIEPVSTTENNNRDDSVVAIEPTDEEKLMQEAMEVDQLRGLLNFSFTKEMDELEKSKALFDLSFIGCNDDHAEQVDVSPTPTITKTNSRKMCKQAEIEQLTEMEISLNKLKEELSKKKLNDDIVLNVSNAGDQSIHCVHDSDSNYSFGEYFNEPKAKDSRPEIVAESPDFIPLPPHIDSDDIATASETISSSTLNAPKKDAQSSAKIFLTKEYARLLLSTEAGNKLLSDASQSHKVKVRMDWENSGNVLVVVGSTENQNEFHEDLIRFLEDMCKKMRIKNETFQQIPRSKVALIRFIREQFALLEQPLGNVNELYKNMRRNENLKSKNGTKNADRARKHLNIILMGRAGLRDGRLHLAGLESNLKFLLENTKDMMTKHTRQEIYQHYRYVFSPFEHEDYPDLIAEYEELKRTKRFPPLNIDKNLLEIKISVREDESVDLNRAKQRLMRVSSDIDSSEVKQESVNDGPSTSDVGTVSAPKTPTREPREARIVKREPKSPKQQLKSQKIEQRTPIVQMKETGDSLKAVDESADSDSLNKNAIWSLKCKDIVEQCRQKHIKSGKVVDKLNTVLEKASRNQLSYADYKNLEKILNTLNQSVN